MESRGLGNVQSLGEMGKDFCQNFLQPFLDNIDSSNCNDGSRELVPVFHNPHRKGRPFPSAVVLTLEYLVGVTFSAASSGRGKSKFGSTIALIFIFYINAST